MQVACPHCSQVLEFASRRPAFCSFCGGSLTAVELHDAATVAYVPQQTHAPLAAAAPHSDPASVGNYRLVRRLGQGGMGVVYEAEQAGTGRRVALKLLAPDIAHDEQAMQRFVREGQSAASFSHPRATFVFEAGEYAGQPYITMELMPGRTLKDVSDEEGPLAVNRAVDAVLDAIEGLEAAHAAGVIHRDVKPSNCFVDGDGRIKIGDFGLSKSLVSDAELTRTGAFLGTPLFAAPEQVRGGAVDARTDIYSLGATLYFLIARRGPFVGDPASVIAQIASDPAPRLKSLVPGVAKDLDGVIARTLEKDPARRFANLGELRRALQPFASAGMTPAPSGRRLGAYFLDLFITGIATGLVTGLVVFVVFLALFVRSGMGASAGGGRGGVQFAVGAIRTSILLASIGVAVCVVAYFALSEAWAGASLGKRIMGLRVVGLDGGRPGFARALLRAAIVPGLMYLATMAIVPFQFPAEMTDFAAFDEERALRQQGLGALLFIPMLFCLVTMRARNGYAGLHDLASRTRVVQTRREAAASRSGAVLTTLAQALPGVQGFGPFRTLGWLGTTGETTIFAARDETLNRPVWVFVRGPGALPLPPSRAAVARPARPRWLQGGPIEPAAAGIEPQNQAAQNGPALQTREGRQALARWDAFEAVIGAPLVRAAETVPLGWDRARVALLELAEELAAAAADSTLPATLSLDNVWLDRDGHVKLLDAQIESLGKQPAGRSPAASPGPEAEPCSPVDLLCAAVERLVGASGPLLEGVAGPRFSALPTHAHEFIHELTDRPDEPQTLVWAVSCLRDSLQRNATLTWGSRLVALGVSMGTEYSFYQVLLAFLLSGALKLTAITEPLGMGAVFASILALPAAAGYFSRGGPVFRLLGIDVRGADDRPAGRARCAWRNVVAWAPGLSAFFINAVLVPYLAGAAQNGAPFPAFESTFGLPRALLVPLVSAVGGGLILVHALGACWSVCSPQRGIQDLLAGTRLAPR